MHRMDGLCSIEEAGKRLEVHRSTINRWLARGDLETVKLGHRRMIVVASIEALLTPSGAAKRIAARVCTDEEVEQTLRDLADMIARARAEAADAR
jgi:excisionase family DNA binding protein